MATTHQPHHTPNPVSYRSPTPTEVDVVEDHPVDELLSAAASNGSSNGAEPQRRGPDGSVEITIGPRPPDNDEANWLPTSPDGQFEVLMRLYGPTPSLYDIMAPPRHRTPGLTPTRILVTS
jgi:hypothetical protein